MAVEVLGCKVRLNHIQEKVLPYSFECTVEGEVKAPADMRSAVVEASRILSGMLSAELDVEGPRHWEFSGERFNLYSFSISTGTTRVGVIRAVEAGGVILNVTGAFLPGSNDLVPGLVDVRERGSLEEGYTIGVTFLRRPSSAGRRLPPGQRATDSFTIYAVEGFPEVPAKWRLSVEGEVSKPLRLSLSDLENMTDYDSEAEFHCVTGWSITGRKWKGVRLSTILEKAGAPRDGWIAAISLGGYTTVLPMEEAFRADAVAAIGLDGGPLPPENGWPARLFLPRLYGWKHGKWLSRLVVLRDYQDGYWEALSYHERGLVSLEERFKIRNPGVVEDGRLPQVKPRPLPPPGW